MTFDPTQYAGAGMDTMDEVSKMPLLKIIQSGSPEVKRSHKDYATRKIEGAQEGMILLQSTGDLIEDSKLEIIVLAHTELYAEWRPESEGGGFIQHHGASIINHADYRQGSEKSKWDEFLGSNELIKTKYFAVLAKIKGEWTKAVLALKKSELKPARQLNDMVKNFRYPDKNCYRWEELDEKGKHVKFASVAPATFARTYWLTTVAQSNDSGDWYNWAVEPNYTFELSGENSEDDLATLQMAAKSLEEATADLPQPEPIKSLEDSSDADEENPY